MMIEEILDEQQEAIVEVDDLSVSFGEQQVLRNINLSIPAGQTVAHSKLRALPGIHRIPSTASSTATLKPVS